ncbi:dihydrofolate reductase [Nocardioides seonyuensis]|uniref:Dihydrofolate reductase n=1 Tax=Nocardioides seonyuensis TaxID=2518371 RepID=A0A4P7IHA1_9ACTN|nr:dihydrofolate reductase family protein [Nocardioides seonyuensis]QBX56053.1 dihydrofolate reductase [Nocardioides seonyuensis]
MATIYYSGCTLDGFIATPDHSLDWLLSRDIDMDGPMAYPGFRQQVGACVMGATTWQWILDHDEEPWGELPTWVLTHRDFPEAPASVRFAQADDEAALRAVHDEMAQAADGKDLWVVGGGELVGRFHDAGLLDEVWLQLAPVTIGAGAPVLPRHVELRLEDVARNRDFLCGRWSVVR